MLEATNSGGVRRIFLAVIVVVLALGVIVTGWFVRSVRRPAREATEPAPTTVPTFAATHPSDAVATNRSVVILPHRDEPNRGRVPWSDAGTLMDRTDVPPDASTLPEIVRGVRTAIAQVRARARDAGLPPETLARLTNAVLLGTLPEALDRLAEGAGPTWPEQIDRYLRERRAVQADAAGDPNASLDALRHRLFTTQADQDRAAAVEQMVEAVDD